MQCSKGPDGSKKPMGGIMVTRIQKFGQHIPDTSGTFTFRSVNDKDINQEG